MEIKRLRRLDVIVLVVIALLVRLAYLWQVRELPFVHELVGDAAGYFAWAGRILQHGWWGDACFYQAPLYPYFLAVVRATLGDEIAMIQVVQVCISVVAVVLLAQATARWFNRRAGVVAGVMLSLYAPAMFYDGLVQKASLSGSATVLLLWWLALISSAKRATPESSPQGEQADETSRRPPHVWPFAALGLTAGMLALLRENALLWAGLLAAWSIVESWTAWRSSARAGCERAHRAWWLAPAYVGGLALALLPVAARNASLCGEWSPTTFQAGPNFYIGNRAEASGLYQPLIRGHETPVYEQADATFLAEQTVGHDLTLAEVSQFWLDRAWSDIEADPIGWLGLLGKKLLITVNRYEVADVESMAVYGSASPLLAGLHTVWHFGVLASLAALGMFVSRDRWRELWHLYVLLAGMVAAVSLFFVLGRYRYPLVPLLVPFAACGVVRLIAAWRSRTWSPRLTVAVMCGVLTAIVVNAPIVPGRRLDAFAYMNLGSAYARSGQLDQAVAALQRSIEMQGDSPTGEARFLLGLARYEQGDVEACLRLCDEAMQIAPDLAGVNHFVGQVFESLGQYDRALFHYRQELAINANNEAVKQAMMRLEGERGG